MARRTLLLGGLAILAVVVHHAATYGQRAMILYTDRGLVGMPHWDQAGTPTYYLLLTLSQSAASSPGGGTAELVSLGQILIAGSTRALWLSFVFLSIGSVLNNWLFYRSRLIPPALAIFGLASTALYTLGSVLALVIELPESATQGMMLPLVLLELSLGFYLAIFGIRQQAPQRGAAALAGS